MENQWANGIGRRIVELASNRTGIVSVCAGFQIIGEEISGLYGIESSSGETVSGLGLLAVKNRIEKE